MRGNRQVVIAPGKSQVYPRVCGGTLDRSTVHRGAKGLSPRVRGNLGTCWLIRSIPACAGEPPSFRSTLASGSIPACAGEPNFSIRYPLLYGVYPRVCGGTRSRLIPACAGEPKEWLHTVYPRVCGGTAPTVSSPAVYPACEVYPRVCGGTCPRVCGGTTHRVDSYGNGLSPRVRGNPGWPAIACIYRQPVIFPWSIPACAGEPVRPAVEVPASILDHTRGLSPRVRGNPSQGSSSMAFLQVYPRVCGGTRAY